MPVITGPKPLASDGRRQRSERNKQLIVAAMCKLIRAGDTNPSAASVAQEAGVGVRTVFRLFEDMDMLYAEMTRQVLAEITPILERPFKSVNWKSQCREACDRRAEVYESLMMLRISANSRRHRSEYLQADYEMFHKQELERLQQILPTEICKNTGLLLALDATMSFDVWHRLRRDRKLPVKRAKEVIELMVDKLIQET